MIKGIFKANRVPLTAFIDNHFDKITEKISEGIIKAIYNAQDKEKQLLMQYQAYSGERIKALSTVPLHRIKIKGKYATILIQQQENKSRVEHFTIIPSHIAQTILKQAKQAGRNTPFPNYHWLWDNITKYAKEKHQVDLTSHYLRKRYFSIAEETEMPVNHWDYLCGSKKSTGHCAQNYSLNDTPKFINEYDTYLSNKLALNNDHPSQTNNTQNTNQDNSDILQTILNELKEIKARLPN